MVIWSKLRHPNVLPFMGFLLENGYPAFVCQWMDGGSLRQRIESGKLGRSQDSILALALGIVKGLAYLHNSKVTHCDLKCDNIYLSPEREPLLADFGQSQLADQSLGWEYPTSFAGTVRWASIELLKYRQGENVRYTKETDVWAFGMVLFELISHKLPFFEIRMEMQVMGAIVDGILPSCPDDIDLDTGNIGHRLWDLCETCWRADPKQRPSLTEISSKLSKIADFAPADHSGDVPKSSSTTPDITP